MHKKVLVVGASGIVGQSVLRHFSQLSDWQCIGASRRKPFDVGAAAHVAIDITDAAATRKQLTQLQGITHLVFAAVHEKPGLIASWSDPEQMQTNLAMLRNVVEGLEAGDHNLQHVTVFQGGKAYGVHIDPAVPVPAKEAWPRHPHQNFYWLQEDYLRARQPCSRWHWTVLRPRLVFGDAWASHMNIVPALAVYASLLKSAGEPLHFPGGPERIYQATDSDLIGRACAWAAGSKASHEQIFNLTNGDAFVWQNVWPAIAEAFGMAPGEHRPCSLEQALPARQREWQQLVTRHGLTAPAELAAFVGQGCAYADFQFNYGKQAPLPASIASTIKIRQAGFGDCIDTEAMLRKWIGRFRQLGWCL